MLSNMRPPLYLGFLEDINTQSQAIHKFYVTEALLVWAIGYHFFLQLGQCYFFLEEDYNYDYMKTKGFSKDLLSTKQNIIN